MDPEDRVVLKEALDRRRRRETIEEALGKVARKRGLDFSAYVRIISEVRDRAHSSGTNPDEAARAILRESDKDA